MASSSSSSSLLYLLLFSTAFALILSSTNAATKKLPTFLLPVFKDQATTQYYTSIEVGTPSVSKNLVIDLGAQVMWFDCESGYSSSSYRPVRCGSTQCDAAKGVGCVGCNGPARPGCTNNTCGFYAYNPLNDTNYSAGLGIDTVQLATTDGLRSLSVGKIRRVPFTCGYTDGLLELAKGAQGMIGLGRYLIALPSQLSLAFKIPRKIAVCLPSSKVRGDIFLGGGPYYMPPYDNDVSSLFSKTPLLINPVSTAPVYSKGDPSDEYFIDVKSILIDEQAVSFNTSLLSINANGDGGTKISTVNPYTELHTNIYRAVIRDFKEKAKARKMKRVEPVAPFDACYRTNKNIGSTKTGPDVPIIDLVLRGNDKKNTSWRIYGANSMVRVKDDVLCLGFVDGGLRPRTSIVIGGYQLEDNLLEFDIESSMLGFTSSLLHHDTSCSQNRRR